MKNETTISFPCRRRPTIGACATQRKISIPRFLFPRFSFPRFLLLLSCLFCLPASADSPDQQIRASYARLDAAYSQRDVPAIMAFLAPNFRRVTWNAALTPAQFQAELKDDFDGTASAAANTRLKSLVIHGETADAVVIRRLDFMFPKPLPELPPPYFHVIVTQEEWHDEQGEWRMTEMADTSLVQTLSLLDSRDQGIRNSYFADRKNRAITRQMGQVDAADQARLKQIIRQYGWPGFDLAGTSGEEAAWEVVQHSDNDVAFQKRCLPLLQAAVKRDQATPTNAAYLTDRILWGEHKPQVYGTQANTPIGDAAHVDERRASVGLAPLAVYETRLRQLYPPKTKS